MEQKLQKLLEALPENRYITAGTLATILGMGIKTVRVKIADLNDELRDSGAVITSRQSYGYRLEINDSERFKAFMLASAGATRGSMPSTPEERLPHILTKLLDAHGHLRLDDIADELYISKASISNDMRRVDQVLVDYKLSLERKPRYGVKIIGKERRKRRLISDFVAAGRFEDFAKRTDPLSLDAVGGIMEAIVKRHGAVFYEAAFKKLCSYLFVGLIRIKSGFNVDADEKLLDGTESESILLLAGEILDTLGKKAGLSFSKCEFELCVASIRGTQTLGTQDGAEENYIVTDRIQQLVRRMLDDIYTEFGVDLRSDLELRISLGTHLLPLDVRMRYDMPLNNPIAEDIKSHYPFAYTVTSRACASLAEHYGRDIPPDEIAYITPFIVIALEKRGRGEKKKSVLLVCATGKAGSQLLAYKFKDEFGEYLERMDTADLLSLSGLNLLEYDCIFTTVPIPFDVPRPIFEVSQFLLQEEIPRVRTILRRSEEKHMRDYYRPEMFFTDIKANDRFGVISEICERINRVYKLPDGFEDAVVKREKFFSTDYGNLVAFPHPVNMMTKDTFVSVAVLDEPIMWERNTVQVVLTVAVAQSGDPKEQLKKFYSVTMNLVTNEKGIRQLIESPTYETLLSLLS